MFRPIQDLMHQVLKEYSQGSKMNTLLSAKREYLSLAGSIHEDSEEYEAKMNCFNDWFLFHYFPDQTEKTVIMQYIENSEVDADIVNAISSVSYSVFEYKKINFRKQMILSDLLHNKNVPLAKTHGPISILEKDLFIGRVITFSNSSFLLSGICMLPHEIHGALSKQCKRIRKLKVPKQELSFLLNLESLKTKWVRFGHVDIEKIFVFH